jgi:hypothetical protein
MEGTMTGPELQAALRASTVGPTGHLCRIIVDVGENGVLVTAIDTKGFTVRSAHSGDARDLARLVEEVTR